MRGENANPGHEYKCTCEDRIARKCIAMEHVEQLRAAFRVLHGRRAITTPYYRDACDSLTYIDGELLDGKHAVASLRNGGRP